MSRRAINKAKDPKITYCSNSRCPFTDCEKHLNKISHQVGSVVGLADFSGVCRDYIGYLVDLATKGELK